MDMAAKIVLCKSCESSFEKDGKKKFCSIKCRQRYFNQRWKLNRQKNEVPQRLCNGIKCDSKRYFTPKYKYNFICPKCAKAGAYQNQSDIYQFETPKARTAPKSI